MENQKESKNAGRTRKHQKGSKPKKVKNEVSEETFETELRTFVDSLNADKSIKSKIKVISYDDALRANLGDSYPLYKELADTVGYSNLDRAINIRMLEGLGYKHLKPKMNKYEVVIEGKKVATNDSEVADYVQGRMMEYHLRRIF